MANWQDIKELEDRIYDAVQEYLNNSEAYHNAVLHVFLNRDSMVHNVEIDKNLPINWKDGVYPVESVIRDGDEGKEPDIDRISDIANSWIFLD